MYTSDARLRDALRALRQILRATELNSRHLAKQTGLNPSQLVLMEILSREDSVTAGTIAQTMSLGQATVTALVDKLERRSLVVRTKDTCDKRRVLLSLTDEGRALLQTAPDYLQPRFAERFLKRKDWEQSMLVSALEQVADMLDAEDLDVAPVLDVGLVSSTPDRENAF